MATHTVKPGESPASIAILYAGCPKCSVDLTRSNPHKPTVTYPNGFISFRSLDVGEVLNLPDKWFNGDLESRPPAYFAALPYADGITPSTLGDAATGVLGDYALLDAAAAKVAALAAMDNASFSNAVGETGSAIDASVMEAYGGQNAAAAKYAQDVQNGTQWAWQRNQSLAASLVPGAPIDTAAATQARLDIQNALTTALGNARLSLNALYAQEPGTPGTGFSPTLVSAAQAAVAAIAADSSYCSSVARSGTAVNSAVHNFKAAWNASQQPPVPINTGNYEAPTASAIQQVFGSAPLACGAAAPQPAPDPPPAHVTCPAGTTWNGHACVAPPVQVAVTQPKGLSTGAVVGIGLLAAGTVGGIAYAATRKPAAAGRRSARRR